MGGDNLLIFGASVRAAAFSALRAGLRPWCADLFADADLHGRCPAMRLPGRYPNAFLDLVGTELSGPWAYTGGLENHAILVGQMADRRQLWGNGPGVLVWARDPNRVAGAARAAGLPAPVVARSVSRPPGPGRWLVKPRGGAGGAGIRFWSAGEPRLRRDVYLQQFIEGASCSALYVGDGVGATLLGLTRQLVGESWLHAAPFHYCGSIGALAVDKRLGLALARFGKELASRTGLRGLFGVDGVLSEGQFWPVEVNPRYPASVEVLEYATGLRALDWHRQAFVGGALPERTGSGPTQVGKAVLFAPASLEFPEDGPWAATLREPRPVTQLPDFADLPHPGERIEAGRPVLTLFARGADEAACLAALRERAADVERWLLRGATLG
jgi:uncharacterized protein